MRSRRLGTTRDTPFDAKSFDVFLTHIDFLISKPRTITDQAPGRVFKIVQEAVFVVKAAVSLGTIYLRWLFVQRAASINEQWTSRSPL